MLNSKTGTIIIYSELGLMVGGLIFHLFVHPQSSFLTFFIGAGLLVSIFIRKNDDKDMFDKISRLD